jgi:hypothetical protein
MENEKIDSTLASLNRMPNQAAAKTARIREIGYRCLVEKIQ